MHNIEQSMLTQKLSMKLFQISEISSGQFVDPQRNKIAIKWLNTTFDQQLTNFQRIYIEI